MALAALAKASRLSLGSLGALGFRALFFDDEPAGVSSAEKPPIAPDSPSSPGGKAMAVGTEPSKLGFALGFLGLGIYTSPRSAASALRNCDSALLGLPRFFPSLDPGL